MILKRHRRSGFTLVEILATVAIIALLSAITAAGIGRVRSAQMSRVTDQTIAKIQLGLDQQWKALGDRVNKEKADRKLNPNLISFCGDDQDRAAALYMYALARREFPQTFAEATGATGQQTYGSFQMQAKSTFSAVTVPSTGSAEDQSAALLYLILSEGSVGGTAFAADEGFASAQTTVLIDGNHYKVFKDAWGTPISFLRFGQNSELDNPPFVNAGMAAGQRDPLDPKRKLANAWPNRSNALGQLALGGVPVDFDGRNKQPVVYSLGTDKVTGGSFDAGDNVLGYRLRKQGERGQ